MCMPLLTVTYAAPGEVLDIESIFADEQSHQRLLLPGRRSRVAQNPGGRRRRRVGPENVADGSAQPQPATSSSSLYEHGPLAPPPRAPPPLHKTLRVAFCFVGQVSFAYRENVRDISRSLLSFAFGVVATVRLLSG